MRTLEPVARDAFGAVGFCLRPTGFCALANPREKYRRTAQTHPNRLTAVHQLKRSPRSVRDMVATMSSGKLVANRRRLADGRPARQTTTRSLAVWHASRRVSAVPCAPNQLRKCRPPGRNARPARPQHTCATSVAIRMEKYAPRPQFSCMRFSGMDGENRQTSGVACACALM